MKQFNKQNVTQLRQELTEVLTELGKKHNLTFNIGNISYDNASVHCKNFSVGIEGAVSPKMLMLSSKLGFNGSAYGGKFTHDGEEFTIISLKPKNKRSIIAKGKSGQYAFPKRMVENANPELFA